MDGNTTVDTDGRAYFHDAKIQEEGMLSLRARPLHYEGLVQSLSCKANSGQFALSFAGFMTPLMDHDATPAAVQAALATLLNISSDLEVHAADGAASSLCSTDASIPFYVEFRTVTLNGHARAASALSFLPKLALVNSTLSLSPLLPVPTQVDAEASGSLIVETLYTTLRPRPTYVSPGNAVMLRIVTQPSTHARAGVVLPQQPVYEVVDAQGRRHTRGSDQVSIDIVRRGRATRLRCDAASGTFRLEWNRQRTEALSATATAAQVQAAVVALHHIEAVTVDCDVLSRNTIDNSRICVEGGHRLCTITITEVACDTTDPARHAHCDPHHGFIPPLTRVNEQNLLQGGRARLELKTDMDALLFGTTIVPLEHGVASFTDLALSSLGRGYTLRARLLGRPSLSSGHMVAPTTPIFVDAGHATYIEHVGGLESVATTAPGGVPGVPRGVPGGVSRGVKHVVAVPTVEVSAQYPVGWTVTVQVTDYGGNRIPDAANTTGYVNLTLVNAVTGEEVPGGVTPSAGSLQDGFATFANVTCTAPSADHPVRLKFSTSTPDMHTGSANTTTIEWLSKQLRCVGPAVGLSITRPAGLYSLPMQIVTTNTTMFVAVFSHAVSVLDVVQRGDALQFHNANFSFVSKRYIVHSGNDYTAFSIPLDRPYVETMDGALWVHRVPTGGVREVFLIHVGGTRCVTSSTDHIMNRQARITWTVECIRTCIFLC